MLINFKVHNSKSFKSDSFLSLNEVSESRFDPDRFTESGKSGFGYISKVAAIFGANGAGKSSLIEAMNYAQNLILNSATSFTQGDKFYFNPHKFDPEFSNSPSEYEFTYKFENSIFRYGFSHNESMIIDEWLFETPLDKSKRLRKWFSREYDPEKDDYVWSENDDHIPNYNFLKKATRNNALFLSSAVRDNSKEMLKPFSWFKDKLRILGANERFSSSSTSEEVYKGKNQPAILELLQNAGMMFSGIKVFQEEFDSSMTFPDEMPKEIKKIILEEMRGKKTYSTKFTHQTRFGEVDLDIDEESDGTKAFYSLAWPLIDVLNSKMTLVVDELHNNLHPNLMSFIIGRFNNKRTVESQLIFSSHETLMMNPSALSDEQIWFVDRDKFGESSTYSLADFPNKRSKNYSKSYTDGRFGAVPSIKKSI